MKNFVQPGRTITVTAPGAVVSGGVVVVGGLVGVANGDAAIGGEVEIDTIGVFELTKVSADVIAQGDKLYWDGVAGKVGKSAGTGAKPLMIATTDAAGGTTTVNVYLFPSGQTGPA